MQIEGLTFTMNYSEESDHAFIIRIWQEQREHNNAPPLWRGVIEHVPSGETLYLQNLVHIITFIIPYLEEMGVQISSSWRWMLWYQHWQASRKRPPGRFQNRPTDQDA